MINDKDILQLHDEAMLTPEQRRYLDVRERLATEILKNLAEMGKTGLTVPEIGSTDQFLRNVGGIPTWTYLMPEELLAALTPKCECGAHAVNQLWHSDYCPLYEGGNK